jgi:adenosylcobinamide kinase/adenosylcobinamide-phosphate guanylyltransferase
LKETVFITGGCRSGKSSFALAFADRHFKRKIFLATCQAKDSEMQQRVKEHQKARGPDWQTVEVPTALPEALTSNGSNTEVMVIDCLTLWVSNLLAQGLSQEEILTHTDALTASIAHGSSSVVIVSNEVGTGIVPENRLAREFRDIAGLVNQKVAAFADTVVWVVAGIPVAVKGVLPDSEPYGCINNMAQGSKKQQ